MPRAADVSKRLRRTGVAAKIIVTAWLVSLSSGAMARIGEHEAQIDLAVNRWFRIQEPSGFLPYDFYFLKDEATEKEVRSPANLGRQAGTAAVLADYYVLTGDTRAALSIQKLLQAFSRHSLPIGASPAGPIFEWTRLLSTPVGRYRLWAALDRFDLLYEAQGPGKVISPDSSYKNAYTGIGALALITELRYFQASQDNQFADLRRAWLEGLIALRIPGDGFRMLPTSIDATPYFDGESWLALAEYHRAFPDDRRVATFLTELDAALLAKYGTKYNQDFFHWGAMAAAARYFDSADPKFTDFLHDQLSQFLSRNEKRDSSGNNCAYIEGVADAMGALQAAGLGESPLLDRARRWTAASMLKARAMQIQPGQQELHFPNAKVSAPRMQDFAGEFRSDLYAADTQVDYTAHCVSAMLKLTRHGISLW